MSVADFVGSAHDRLADNPTLGAGLHAVGQEAAVGLRARYHYLKSRGSGITTCSCLGTTFRWRVDSISDGRRGPGLAAELDAARWLFAGESHTSRRVAEQTLWDVGAHHGNWSCLAAALGCRVRAFEPTPGAHARCVENLELNGCDVARGDRATVDDRALSDHHGRVAVPESSLTTSLDAPAGAYEAPVVPGDAVAAPAPELLKVDVEGHEAAVLRGLTETLPDVERVVVEIHPEGDGEECRSILQAAGFDVREVPCSRTQTYLGAWRA